MGTLVFLVGGLVMGCQAPPAPDGPTARVLHLPDREVFLDETLTLLRRYDLPPERVDRSRGEILSRRTTSGQWFEFWRVDAPGAYQALESSLHTIGRVVKITLTPVSPASTPQTEPSGGDYRVTVQVDKYRYSVPERQVTTASGALAIYSERLPTTEGLRRARSESERWIPLGRDPLLEKYLLAQLESIPGVTARE